MITRVTSHFSLRLFSQAWLYLQSEWWHEQDTANIFWCLYRNARDGVFIRVNGETLPMSAGVNYLIPPGCRFDYWCEGCIEQLWICFDVLGFSPSAVKLLFPEPFALSLSPLSTGAMDDIATYPQSEVSLVAHWRCVAAITEGLLYALEALPPERLEGIRYLTNDETAVTAALQHIEANLAERLPNRELAARCSMSEAHFIRQFRANVGQTPAQYVLEARVKMAAQHAAFLGFEFGGDRVQDRLRRPALLFPRLRPADGHGAFGLPTTAADRRVFQAAERRRREEVGCHRRPGASTRRDERIWQEV